MFLGSDHFMDCTVVERKNKRTDPIVFVNGIPVVLFELKNMTKEDTTIEQAYKQIRNYQLDIPGNEFGVITDGFDTRMSTITSDFIWYMVWK